MAKNRSSIKAGSAFIQLFIEDALMVRQLGNASRHLKRFGANVMKLGASFAAFGGAMAVPLFKAINVASKLQETMNKFDVVFGDAAKATKAWGDSVAGSVGRSKQQIAEFLAGAQDLFVPIGFAADEAENLSKQVTKLAIDLASFNNMADADVMRDLKAALTGSSEVMKKYGVLTNEAAVKQEMLNMGLDPKTATDMQKVQARLNLMMKGTVAAQGDALRSAGSYENQMKKLEGVTLDAAASIGNALIPVVTPLVTQLASAVESVGAFTDKNHGLVVSIAKGAAAVAAFGAATIAAGAAVFGAGAVLGGLSTVFGAFASAVGFVLSPMGLLAAGLATAVTLLGKLAIDLGLVRQAAEFVSKEFKALTKGAGELNDAISDAIAGDDYIAAAKMMWAGVTLVYMRGMNKILERISGFRLAASAALGLFKGGAVGGVSAAIESKVNEIKRSSAAEAEIKGQEQKLKKIASDAEAAKKKAARDAAYAEFLELAKNSKPKGGAAAQGGAQGGLIPTTTPHHGLITTSSPIPDRAGRAAERGRDSGVQGSFNAAATLSLQAVSAHDNQMLAAAKRTADNTEEIANNQPTF